MQLTETDYKKLQPFFQSIERVSRLSQQGRGDTGAWYVMDEIKFTRTGFRSDGQCGGCVIELYHEFQNAILQYESTNEVEGKKYSEFMKEGVS